MKYSKPEDITWDDVRKKRKKISIKKKSFCLGFLVICVWLFRFLLSPVPGISQVSHIKAEPKPVLVREVLHKTAQQVFCERMKKLNFQSRIKLSKKIKDKCGITEFH